MPEILQLLLPTNIWTFLIWAGIILIILVRSKKIQTKWFSLEMEKTKTTLPGAEGEMILKDRLLKEYKIFKSNVLSNTNKIRVCFRSNFREALILYMNKVNGEANTCCLLETKNVTIKTYENLLELSLRISVVPMLLNMVFRNGFPKLPPSDDINTDGYKSAMGEFTKACTTKFNDILVSLELAMDTEWYDFTIDPSEYKKFYHSSDSGTSSGTAIENSMKEIISFFTRTIKERDEIIKIIYKDFPKLFTSFEGCQKFCELYLRDLYE